MTASTASRLAFSSYSSFWLHKITIQRKFFVFKIGIVEQKLYNFKARVFFYLKQCFSMVVFNFVSYVSWHGQSYHFTSKIIWPTEQIICIYLAQKELNGKTFRFSMINKPSGWYKVATLGITSDRTWCPPVFENLMIAYSAHFES